jgi:hypothetical protein
MLWRVTPERTRRPVAQCVFIPCTPGRRTCSACGAPHTKPRAREQEAPSNGEMAVPARSEAKGLFLLGFKAGPPSGGYDKRGDER